MSLIKSFFPEIEHAFRRQPQALSRLPSLFNDPWFNEPLGLHPYKLEQPLKLSGILNQSLDLLNVIENEKGFVVEADVPGFEKNQIQLEVLDENKLMISAEAESTTETSQSRSSFKRWVEFPTKIDPDSVQAQLKNGVLKLEIPKIESSRKKIEIEE